MQLEITEPTVFEGKPVKVGDIVTTDSKFLIHIGKAKAHEAPKKPAKKDKKNDA